MRSMEEEVGGSATSLLTPDQEKLILAAHAFHGDMLKDDQPVLSDAMKI